MYVILYASYFFQLDVGTYIISKFDRKNIYLFGVSVSNKWSESKSIN